MSDNKNPDHAKFCLVHVKAELDLVLIFVLSILSVPAMAMAAKTAQAMGVLP
jgi:hypothetical protein